MNKSLQFLQYGTGLFFTFENAEETEAGVMYKIKLHSNELEAMYRFETKENPYYFG